MSHHCAAIILAGGFSSRMNQPKPLLPFNGETITDHVIATYSGVDVDVFLVVGHRKDDILKVIKKQNITIIDNPDYEKGMFSSIKAGIRGLPSNYRAFFINPVDIPLVKPVTIKLLMEKSANDPDKIIYPVYNGRRGHPPLIPSDLIPAILGWEEEGGLKTALKSFERLALNVLVNDDSILFDIDTPEDYQGLLKRYSE